MLTVLWFAVGAVVIIGGIVVVVGNIRDIRRAKPKC